MRPLRERWPVLLILLASLIALAPALRPGHAIGPWDDLHAMVDGRVTPRAFDVLQMDAVLQFYGWRDLVFESWSRFEPPYWNPYQLMGTPLLANSQSGGFYPLHILVGALHLPTWLGVLLLAWFHLVVGGLGVRALVLRTGGTDLGAAVGGALFAVSPFMLSWVGLASVVTTCVWIPWALAFVHDLFAGRSRSLVWLSVALALMVLGGHLQFAAYGFMAVALFAIVQLFQTRQWPGLGLSAAGCVLGLCLAAPQLLPVLEYSKHGHRQNNPTEESYGFYVRGAVEPVELTGVVFPDLLGTPGRPAAVESDVPLPSFWPAYTKIGGNYAESALYLGPAVVLLLALALFRRGWRTVAAVSAVGVFGLLLALGTPLNKALYFWLPGWSSTGSPGRVSVLFVIAACAVAGWAWPREGEKLCVRKPLYALFGFAALTVALVTVVAPSIATWNPNLQSVSAGAVAGNLAFVLPIALVALALVVGGAFALKNGRPGYAALGLVLAALVVAGPRLVPAGEPLQRGTPDPNTRYAFVNADWQLLVGLPVVQPPNTATIERKFDVAGYDSLIHSETFKILNEINGQDSAPEANGNMTLIKPDYVPQRLAEAGVARVVSRDEAGTRRTVLLDRRRASVVPSSSHLGSDPIEVPSDLPNARIVRDTLTETTVTAQGPGTLVLRDRNMPGWTATVDGKPAEIHGDRWREVELSPGEHVIVFTYLPPGLRAGLVAFAIGALASAVALWLTRPR